LEESFDIFHELSFEGYADAMTEIGKAMIEGIGTPKNEEMGNKYLRYGKIIGEDIAEHEKRAEKMYEDLKIKKK
jgi:phage-related minor tail protein